MCHQSCISFTAQMLTDDIVKGKDILEVGSFNVNGSVRGHIESKGPGSYIGIDMREGPGVDFAVSIEDKELCSDPRFNKQWDIVVTTEMMEHVKDWRMAVINLKRLVKPGGYLLITTRSKGFGYHEFPCDYWRYEIDDMKRIFADFIIISLLSDGECPGVFLLAQKPSVVDLDAIELYAIVG